MISALLDRPIAFQPVFVDLTGSVAAALLLSQAVYWQQRAARPGGWWWKTRAEWQHETRLTRHEQEAARRLLRRHKFWAESRRGVPARTFFRVDLDLLLEALSQISLENPQFAENRQTRLPDSGKQECRKVANQLAENRPTNTYTTTQITTETTTTPSRAAAKGGQVGGGQKLDFCMLDSKLAGLAAAALEPAGLPPEAAQQVLDEVSGQIQSGAARFPRKLLAALVQAAQLGELEQTRFGQAARQQRLARQAAAAQEAETARRTAIRQAELAEPMPEKYLKDQRVQRLMRLGKPTPQQSSA